jgi:PST family polysaccharide transporter
VVSIVAGIILARILDPVDYGIVGLAQVVLGTMSLFSGFGLGGALIQSQADRGKAAYQSFCINAVTGVLLFLVVFALADVCAALLGNAQVTPVLRWMAPIVIFGNLAIVPESLLQKDLLFGRVSVAVVTAEILNVGVSIALAVAGYGLWSLVYGGLTRWVVYDTLIWTLNRRREWIVPKPWDNRLMRDLLRFGIQSTGGGVVTFLYATTDNFIVGRWLGATALGLYGKAYDFTSRTVDSLNNVIGAVLIPSYSLIQTDGERLSRAYLKSLRMIAMVTVPVAMGMYITAPEMISVLLGEKWLGMIAPFEVLAFVSVVKPLSATTSALFMSRGHPGYNFRAGLVVFAVLVPMIFALLGYGTTGVAFAVLAAHIAGFAYNLYQVHLTLPHTASRMLPAVLPAFGSTAVMMLAVWGAKHPLLSLAGGAHSAGSLVLMILVGIASYAGAVALLQRSLVREVLEMIRSRRTQGAH